MKPKQAVRFGIATAGLISLMDAARSQNASTVTPPEVLADQLRSQGFPCDRTRNVPGYLAYRLGLRRRPTRDEVAAQVTALVPAGGAYTAALCALFLSRIGMASAMPASA